MQDSDPQNQRVEIVNKLVDNKPDGFKYAVYSFSDSSVKLRDMKGTSDPFDATFFSDGGTGIRHVLNEVINDVSLGDTETGQSTRVLLLSDGYATDISFAKWSLKSLLKKYVNNNLIVSTVGLGNSVDESLMTDIASMTGGVYVHADDINNLATAMKEAAIGTKDRTMLGFRGYCKTNTLHMIMRILFIFIIGVFIDYLKITVYGGYRKIHIAVLVVALVLASMFAEFGFENLPFQESTVRMIMFALLAAFLIDKMARSRYVPHGRDEYAEEDGGFHQNLPGTDELQKGPEDNTRDFKSLGD